MKFLKTTIILLSLITLLVACSDSSKKSEKEALADDCDRTEQTDGDSTAADEDIVVDMELDETPDVDIASSDDDVESVTGKECGELNREFTVSDGKAQCGDCLEKYLEESGLCRAVSTCEELKCGELHSRKCISEESHKDAECGDCIDNAVSDGGECVLQNCEKGAPGSMHATCKNLHKICMVVDGLAFCDECEENYVSEGGLCNPKIFCKDISSSCVSKNRECIEGDPNIHATCAECSEGYEEISEECVKILPPLCGDIDDVNSQSKKCKDLNRQCVETESGAKCGECFDNYLEVEDSQECIYRTESWTCETLKCEESNKGCSEAPVAHCTGCLPGFKKAGNECVKTKTCADISCQPQTETCIDLENDDQDAFCRKSCPGATQIWNGVKCESCPKCDEEGEDGIWPWPTLAGNCICKTKPGYFYSVAAEMGVIECDKDKDGWVRESARIFINSEDPALRINARCDLRKVDRFKLVNEADEEKIVPVDPTPLYETERNDDRMVLLKKWQELELPKYGTGESARYLKPEEINSLTKVCHTILTDYNDNGIADVDEHGIKQVDPFRKFSYFMELNHGYFQAPGEREMYGTYVIREKKRPAPDTAVGVDSVPIYYSIGDDSRWRTCHVMRDIKWEEWKVGMDLAPFHDYSWSGMNHHSQFKCVVIDSNAGKKDFHKMTKEQYASEKYTANKCSLSSDLENLGDGDIANPKTSLFSCNLAGENLESGQVVWSAVPFIPHGKLDKDDPLVILDERTYKFDTYVRGCVNECITAIEQCHNYKDTGVEYNPKTTKCIDDPGKFGKKVSNDVQNFCIGVEICNGRSDDGDLEVDEGYPESGEKCLVQSDDMTTQLEGVCRYGTKRCEPKTSGEIDACCQDEECTGCFECVPQYQKGDLTEICDGLDNDCDGETDESFPTKHEVCYASDEQGIPYKGICGVGKKICSNGKITCDTHKARAEECVPGVIGEDEDCDGEVDEAPNGPLSTMCEAPWKMYYKDEDGDGYGPNADFRCLCHPDVANKYTATKAWDCCDNDNRVHPGQTNYFNGYSNCGSYDYNCNNEIEKNGAGYTR